MHPANFDSMLRLHFQRFCSCRLFKGDDCECYLPMGHIFMHSEQPPEALQKELQANLFNAYRSSPCGFDNAPAGQISRQRPQLSQLTFIQSLLVGSSAASVRQQDNLILDPKSELISMLCQPNSPSPAACPPCLKENTASKNLASVGQPPADNGNAFIPMLWQAFTAS